MKPTLFLLTALLLTPLGALHAATYIVAPTGNDSNPGTEAHPFRTIQKGADVATAGDTVRVMETRPLSKMKRWRLVEIVERAK